MVAKLHWHTIDIETQNYENKFFWKEIQTEAWNQNSVVLIGSNIDPDFAMNDHRNIYLVSPVSCLQFWRFADASISNIYFTKWQQWSSLT